MTQVNLENRELTHERLEFGSGVVCFLGPMLTLRGCTLVLGMSARNLIIPQARFIDCTFIIKKPLKDFRWDTAHLRGCRFKGRFSGNDFGSWPDRPTEGSIEGCDFSEAHLNWTRFLGCDTQTLRFPSWPCFTILEPAARWRELQALPWPGEHGSIFGKRFAKDPPSTVAVTHAAPELAAFCGTTEEAIRAVLEQVDGVYL
ncbi:pentapeptide repeat-containing protein [Hyalangium gracile]|uniref:pentapeptide repeat-containing protein n=1 Tax=Hyalangium gracile TaxID=394092 RepID=UPI001CC8FD5B|nr:pentapeptide repeat-containing protein [Hyalangium gracile]